MTNPSSTVDQPSRPCPPLRTRTATSLRRAHVSASTTFCVSAQKTTAFGWWEYNWFQPARAVSYPESPGHTTSPVNSAVTPASRASVLEDIRVSRLCVQHFAVRDEQIGEVHPADQHDAERDSYGGQCFGRRHENEHHDDRPHQRRDRDRQVEPPQTERVFLLPQPFSHRQVQNDDSAVEARADHA